MTMSDKLIGVHPDLIAAINKIVKAMDALGHPIMVTQGLRTVTEQKILYAQGRTTAGPIVTNADGVKSKSNHQAHDDGFGHAIDVAFLVDGKPSWDEHLPWRAYGECGKALGLVWGGDFAHLVDKPHLELV